MLRPLSSISRSLWLFVGWLANARAARGWIGISGRNGAFVFLGSLVETKRPNAGERSALK